MVPSGQKQPSTWRVLFCSGALGTQRVSVAAPVQAAQLATPIRRPPPPLLQTHTWTCRWAPGQVHRPCTPCETGSCALWEADVSGQCQGAAVPLIPGVCAHCGLLTAGPVGMFAPIDADPLVGTEGGIGLQAGTFQVFIGYNAAVEHAGLVVVQGWHQTVALGEQAAGREGTCWGSACLSTRFHPGSCGHAGGGEASSSAGDCGEVPDT